MIKHSRNIYLNRKLRKINSKLISLCNHYGYNSTFVKELRLQNKNELKE